MTDEETSESHTQAEWDALEREKLASKSQPKMTYAQYKRQLVLRNLAFNFRNNAGALIKKATPIVQGIATNMAANANGMVEGEQPKKKAMPKKPEEKKEGKEGSMKEWAEAFA